MFRSSEKWESITLTLGFASPNWILQWGTFELVKMQSMVEANIWFPIKVLEIQWKSFDWIYIFNQLHFFNFLLCARIFFRKERKEGMFLVIVLLNGMLWLFTFMVLLHQVCIQTVITTKKAFFHYHHSYGLLQINARHPRIEKLETDKDKYLLPSTTIS